MQTNSVVEGADALTTRQPEGSSPVPTGCRRAGRRLALPEVLSRKLLHLVLVLLALSLVTFLMLQALPGSIVDQMLGDNASPADIARFEAELGLDQPVPVRYLKWLGHAVRGDLGRSPISGEDVAQAIRQRLPTSLQLMLYAQVLALLIALPLGTWAGYREGSRVDRAISGGAFGVLAIPHFVLGILLILVFAIKLPWFPATGHIAFDDDPIGSLRSMALPSLTLALVEAPVYLRLLRSDIASTMREEFITVARAKGLSDRHILLRHALRPSSLGLVTVLGINIGHLIGGAVIIETVFALPGVGRLLIEAIIKRDYVPLQGVVLFIGTAFVLVNMLVDALYAVIDPRLTRQHGR